MDLDTACGTMSHVLGRGTALLSLPLLLAACATGSSGGGHGAGNETPFSSIGDPVGDQLGQVLFTVADGAGKVDVRLETLGPNPPGSPVSCDKSPHTAGTRLVPLYVNGTSHDPKSGVADIGVKITVVSSGVSGPLLVTTTGGSYVATCDPAPVVRLDGMKAGIQHVIRGVAVVKDGARQATVVLTAPDGSAQRRRVPV
ncbi:MAG TPA: hypothetical protein VFH66_00415 [Mycobacteriales bacterium]|nr:hypothetical protein [Mycobacteriales bacterium]